MKTRKHSGYGYVSPGVSDFSNVKLWPHGN